MKEKIKTSASILFAIIVFWALLSGFIQWDMCDDMTQMQIFKNLPNSFILNFKKC